MSSSLNKINLFFFFVAIFFYRLVTISSCAGVAGTLCIICSYQRVPCHLQDPLKGAALVYSLVFYFFFCRKGMYFLFLIALNINLKFGAKNMRFVKCFSNGSSEIILCYNSNCWPFYIC